MCQNADETFERRSIWQLPENKTATGNAAVDVPPATESFRSVNEKYTSVCVRSSTTRTACVLVNSSRNRFWRVDRIGPHQV